MKTKEELNALKAEVETLGNKLAELSEEELAQVAGGGVSPAMIGAGLPLTTVMTIGIMVQGLGKDGFVTSENRTYGADALAKAGTASNEPGGEIRLNPDVEENVAVK